MKVWACVCIFFIGVGIGYAGTQLMPTSVSKYLPVGLQPQTQVVKGVVVRKHKDGERLLLTVSTPQGALLATFTQHMSEIDLLVEERDEVTLGLAHYAPFIHDPVIKGVMKPDQLGIPSSADSASDQETLQLPESASEPVPTPSEQNVVDPKI